VQRNFWQARCEQVGTVWPADADSLLATCQLAGSPFMKTPALGGGSFLGLCWFSANRVIALLGQECGTYTSIHFPTLQDSAH
jgi:hypothetical protein